MVLRVSYLSVVYGRLIAQLINIHLYRLVRKKTSSTTVAVVKLAKITILYSSYCHEEGTIMDTMPHERAKQFIDTWILIWKSREIYFEFWNSFHYRD